MPKQHMTQSLSSILLVVYLLEPGWVRIPSCIDNPAKHHCYT